MTTKSELAGRDLLIPSMAVTNTRVNEHPVTREDAALGHLISPRFKASGQSARPPMFADDLLIHEETQEVCCGQV